MATTTSHVLLVLLFYIGKSNGQYTFISRDSKDEFTAEYNEYPSIAINDIDPYKVNSKLNYSDCVRDCEADKMECEAINVIKEENGTFSCYYFTTEKGKFKTKQINTIYISRRQVSFIFDN